MHADEKRRYFGPEYPAAIFRDGKRIELDSESRFSRTFSDEQSRTHWEISRFMDGSAAISADQLKHEWPEWSRDTRLDFTQNCHWLHEQDDFPEMLRFMMQHGGEDDWSAVASSVGKHLPMEEAFDLLTRAMQSTPIGRCSNLTQGIALTKHPKAADCLRAHLERTWNSEHLWDDDPFLNWPAYDASCCIEHLLELGSDPTEFAEKVRRLAKHACKGNREPCRRRLEKYYPELLA
jgi:hypothetical protein